MMSRLPVVVIFLSTLLALLACGQTPTPMPTPEPTLTPMPTPMPTLTPTPTPPAGSETKGAVQLLFDNLHRATQEKDATLFHSLLTRELAGSCELRQVQSWLDRGAHFPGEVEVRSVFLDIADSSRAYAEIPLGQSGGRPEQALNYPWLVALEDGEWRAGFPVGWVGGSCPYAASERPSGPEGRGREFPQIPGLDLNLRRDVLAAVLGTRVLHGSYRTGNSASSFSSGGSMSPYENQINIYAELETDSATAEVVRLYRDGLEHPSWDIIDEDASGDFGWLSWTVIDGEGLLWHGKLVVAPSHEGWRHVWLSLYSEDSGDSQ